MPFLSRKMFHVKLQENFFPKIAVSRETLGAIKRNKKEGKTPLFTAK